MDRIEKSIGIEAPVRAVYAHWTHFEDFPSFLEGVREVRRLGERRLAWRAGALGAERQWEAELVEEVPDRVVAWRAKPGEGPSYRLAFEPADGGGTHLTMVVELDMAGVRHPAAQLSNVALRMQRDLDRCKKLLEAERTDTGKVAAVSAAGGRT